jgi:hypothetical protein
VFRCPIIIFRILFLLFTALVNGSGIEEGVSSTTSTTASSATHVRNVRREIAQNIYDGDYQGAMNEDCVGLFIFYAVILWILGTTIQRYG